MNKERELKVLLKAENTIKVKFTRVLKFYGVHDALNYFGAFKFDPGARGVWTREQMANGQEYSASWFQQMLAKDRMPTLDAMASIFRNAIKNQGMGEQ